MNNNLFFKIFYSLAAIVLVINMIALLKDEFSYSTDYLPTGEKCAEFLSPEGDKRVEVYLVRNALGVAVRAQYLPNDGETAPRNIYWQTDTDITDVKWQSNRHVDINGVVINVDGGYAYDSRKGASIFRSGALGGIAVDEENTND